MEHVFSDNDVTLYWGDALECLREIPNNIIQAVITSPTYWGKRRFTKDSREFGSEKLESYIDRNVTLYSNILEKMKDDGSLFVVIQDTYMGSGVSRSHHNHWEHNKDQSYRRVGLDSQGQGNTSSVTAHHPVIKNKSLSAIPYRIAIKLVDAGYIWRQQIIWEKPNPMPENIRDRVRQSAEYILHFTKRGNYKFNRDFFMVRGESGRLRMDNQVWVAAPEPAQGHTATFPSRIVRRLLLAVTDTGDLVFEPFLGSGKMMRLCIQNHRKFIGCDINKDFVKSAVNLIPKKIMALDPFL
jgi:site-specific DNA-methyltransferase (cytosine-N4-specific)